MKVLLILLSTYLIAPAFGVVVQKENTPPDIFLYYVAFSILWSHELVIGVFPGLRVWLKTAFEKSSKADYKPIIAAYFSLLCVRLVSIGKLKLIFFGVDPMTHQEYYYLVLIIFICIGFLTIDKILEPLAKRK